MTSTPISRHRPINSSVGPFEVVVSRSVCSYSFTRMPPHIGSLIEESIRVLGPGVSPNFALSLGVPQFSTRTASARALSRSRLTTSRRPSHLTPRPLRVWPKSRLQRRRRRCNRQGFCSALGACHTSTPQTCLLLSRTFNSYVSSVSAREDRGPFYHTFDHVRCVVHVGLVSQSDGVLARLLSICASII